MAIKSLRIKSDSMLIVNQIKGEYAAKDSKMTTYLGIVNKMLCYFKNMEIEQVPRDQNMEGDALAKLRSCFKSKDMTTEVPLVHLMTPAVEWPDIKTIASVSKMKDETSWQQPIINWLKDYVFHVGKKHAQGFKMNASQLILIDNNLFKKFVEKPYLRCLDKDVAL